LVFSKECSNHSKIRVIFYSFVILLAKPGFASQGVI